MDSLRCAVEAMIATLTFVLAYNRQQLSTLFTVSDSSLSPRLHHAPWRHIRTHKVPLGNCVRLSNLLQCKPIFKSEVM